jgi:hypothetical protein
MPLPPILPTNPIPANLKKPCQSAQSVQIKVISDYQSKAQQVTSKNPFFQIFSISLAATT